VSAQVKPYSEIQKRNIYDSSHTGGSKTTRAIEFIEHEISNGRPVIVVMQDYATVEVAYLKRFSLHVLSKSLIIKGKTQAGMCVNGERYSKLYKFIHPPNECKECPEQHACQYQNQSARLKQLLDSSSEGFVILTTPRMLDGILSQCQSILPSIIIDDVPISQVIASEILDTQGNLTTLIEECNTFLWGNLSTIADMLLTQKPADEILDFMRQNKGAIEDELHRSQTMINGLFTGGNKFAKYDSLYGLFHAVSCDTSVDIFYDEHGIFGVIKIFSTKKNLQQYRILYLNASRNDIDEYYLDQLEDLEPYCVESGDNPQFTIYQLVDAKYGLSSILNSPGLVEKVTATCDHFKQIISDLGMKIPFFTHDKSYEQKFKPDDNFQQIGHSFVKFYGTGTKGTNEFLKVPISVIVGTPFLPASYFMHPAFKNEWRSDSDIAKDVAERDRRKRAGLYTSAIYPVNKCITERCAVEQLIQIIGRTLRVDPNNPDREKFVILFSKLDDQEFFEKECKIQNGSKVVKFQYDRLKDRQNFFSRIDRALPSIFLPVIMTKVFERLDEELARGACPKLGEFSKERAEEIHKLVSYKTIAREISPAYDTTPEDRSIGVRGKAPLIIIKKKSLSS
jgi:hypothetical protein